MFPKQLRFFQEFLLREACVGNILTFSGEPCDCSLSVIVLGIQPAILFNKHPLQTFFQIFQYGYFLKHL